MQATKLDYKELVSEIEAAYRDPGDYLKIGELVAALYTHKFSSARC